MVELSQRELVIVGGVGFGLTIGGGNGCTLVRVGGGYFGTVFAMEYYANWR
jgi:hypothetical protein